MSKEIESIEESKILVWDWPIRVFHWSLAICIFIAYFTGESERFSVLHQTLGYAAAGLLAFRLVWGFTGTRYARFSEFITGPSDVFNYLKSIRNGHAEHYTGHNPVGGLAVFILIALAVITSFTAWSIADGDAQGWLEELHELSANTLMTVVAFHITGVVFSSRLHKENLVLAMLTGYKTGKTHMAIANSWRWLAVLLILSLFGYIYSQFQF
jgi:cytochrome b